MNFANTLKQRKAFSPINMTLASLHTANFMIPNFSADVTIHALPTPPQNSGKGQPIFNVPPIVTALILLCGIIYFIESHLTLEHFNALINDFGFVPARLFYQIWPHGFVNLSYALLDPNQAHDTVVLAHTLFIGENLFWTILTYAFLHGSWTHIGLNMLWLAAFGAPLARRLGSLRFLALFCLSAIAGSLFHALCFPTQIGTLIGASASVCAMMGGVARFMGYNRILGEAIANGPMPSLSRAMQNKSVRFFVLIWFVGNLAFGLLGGFISGESAPIAWQAHVGGFFFGFLCLSWFDPRALRAQRA